VLKKSLIAVLIIIASAFIGIYSYLNWSIPQIEGQVKLPIKGSSVEIVRDKYGIPHITAENKYDLYFALGHTTASDRLFQMDIYRRISSGRLSEVLGKGTLEIDKMFRTFSLVKHVKKQIKTKIFDKDMLENYKAYLAGINHYAKNGKLPIEFKLLNYSPDEFTFEESLAFVGYMSFSFSTSLRQDLLFAKLLNKLKPVLVNDLRNKPDDNFHNMFALSDTSIKSVVKVVDDLITSFSAFEGSNAWAVAPEKSKSGYAILASDPHIAFSLPGIWYEASLHLKNKDLDLYGHFIPGLPFAILGHNQHLGWGLTMSFVDDMDFYKEKINHTNNTVFYKGKWVELERSLEVIKVKGEDDYQFPLITTPHGPVLDQVIEEKDISIKWSQINIDNQVANGFYKINYAKNIEEFKAGISLGHAPGVNVVYADKVGNIAHWIHGEVPQRDPSVNGDFLLDGSNPKHEYLSSLKFEEKPNTVNPKSGYVVSANSWLPKTKKRVEGNFQPGDRGDTITENLMKEEKWDLEGLKKIQTSLTNNKIRERLTILLNNLNESKFKELDKSALETLRSWNFFHRPNQVAPTIYYEWYRNINKSILDELTEDEFSDYCKLSAFEHFFDRMLKSPSNTWWDKKETTKVENPKEIITDAFIQTIKKLKSEMGPDVVNWNWGKVHTVEFTHTLGRKEPFNLIFNLGPMPAPGAHNVVNNFRSYGCDNSYKVKAGPSTRRLIDFKDSSISWGILPIGNSGHNLSPFFKDQNEMYMNGKYRRQYLKVEDVRKTKHYVLKYLK
jgi:penicillin amidase